MAPGKAEISILDYQSNPVWYFDDEEELFHPLESLEAMIDSLGALRVYAEFITPTGDFLKGSVSGKGDVAISIFKNGRWYSANKNWKQTSISQLTALIEDSTDLRAESVDNLLPLKFSTLIRRDPFLDWSGTFDLSEL